MSLTSPSLPTDNLYKFLAIAGLVAAIAGLYFSFNIYLDLRESRWEAISEIEILKTRDAETEEMVALLETFKRLEKKEKELDPVAEILAKAAVVSLFLSIAGFILWYIKVQRYLDKEMATRGSKEQPNQPLQRTSR